MPMHAMGFLDTVTLALRSLGVLRTKAPPGGRHISIAIVCIIVTALVPRQQPSVELGQSDEDLRYVVAHRVRWASQCQVVRRRYLGHLG